MGFNLHFYIIFGTNLLTKGLVQIAVFLPISVFGIQTEWNLRESYFWNNRDLGDLEWPSRKKRGAHKAGGVPRGQARPHPCGPLVAPLTYFFRLYILIYPKNIQEHHETLFPPPQPSVPVRSHLGAFSGAPPEGGSTTEGHYINILAPPMSCE